MLTECPPKKRVKAILDANRNSLMLLDLKFTIGALGLAAGTLFSGLFGMNLTNFIEESGFAFGSVSVTSFAITAAVCVYGLAKLRKVQRVRMWGEGVGGGPISPFVNRNNPSLAPRTNWRAESIEPIWAGIPGEGRAERLRRFKEGAAATTIESSEIDEAAHVASMHQSMTAAQSARNEHQHRQSEQPEKPEQPKASPGEKKTSPPSQEEKKH